MVNTLTPTRGAVIVALQLAAIALMSSSSFTESPSSFGITRVIAFPQRVQTHVSFPSSLSVGCFIVYQSLYSCSQPTEETSEEELSIESLEELSLEELSLEELSLDELLFDELEELSLDELSVGFPFLAIPEGVVTSSGISLPKSNQAYSG